MVVLRPPPPTGTARTTTMSSGSKGRYLAPSATPWDGVPAHELTPAERLVKACHSDMYRYRHAPVDLEGEAEFFNGYARAACPRCGAEAIKKSGRDANGLRRWMCRSCGRTFNPATGTIFEGHRLPVADWTEFLIEAFSFSSLNTMTRENRRSSTTLPLWFAKLFAVLEGIQDDVVLSGRVEIDEKYYPVAESDMVLRPDGSKLRGFSRNHLCIALGAQEKGRCFALSMGRGKPSRARAEAAYAPHIARGSVLVHDMERSHQAVVERLGLVDERHNSADLKGIPDKDNPLRNVDGLCLLLEVFLNSHSGFRRDRLQGYLDLFSVAMNPPASKMEKAAMVLDRAMRCAKTLRYRDFYAKGEPSNRENAQ